MNIIAPERSVCIGRRVLGRVRAAMAAQIKRHNAEAFSQRCLRSPTDRMLRPAVNEQERRRVFGAVVGDVQLEPAATCDSVDAHQKSSP